MNELDTEILNCEAHAELYQLLKSRAVPFPNPDDPDEDIRDRIEAGTITVNERRARGFLPPLPGGDVPYEKWEGRQTL